jgi:glutamate N-acetyltransferase / amino-acid N-acetyltransferase
MKLHLDRGATAPQGFHAAAVACALKASGNLDLALLHSELPCTAAGVFTRNRVVAAPVLVDRETLAGGGDRIRAVVSNAGNANACTGERGLADARAMQRLTATRLGVEPGQVLVLSTGVIGVPMDMEKVTRGIEGAATALGTVDGATGDEQLARALMTTDLRPKRAAVAVELSGGQVTVGGVAKGSGMIHPDMATMLAILTTDAAVPVAALDALLRHAVDRSFHRITVDGDTSTNDTVFLLANGASGVTVDNEKDSARFQAAVTAVATQLARAIIEDGEGATHFVTLRVSGARTEAEAARIARTIATSPLVKTAFAGGDPNWGRILAAAGRAGVEIDPDRLALVIDTDPPGTPVQLVENGGATHFVEADAAAIFAQERFLVHLDLGLGEAEAEVWTCDLTHDYVRINADYRT